VAELRTWVENKEYLQDIDLDGYATETYVEEAIANIEIPETEIYKVDFNAPDYTKAVEAYNNGKVLVLINAVPDINSYAIMNYVRDDIISFTKFLMSRSGTYGSFNTYYLHNDGTWELAKEVKLNKVEITNDGDLQVGKQTLEIPSVDGFATEEYVDNKIGEIRLPEAELFVVDFNAPDFAAAVEAYNNGKFLVLANAAPDANGYAVMNYVRADLITFTKFLTSRSEAYGLFNTYYLSPANT
jgi:3-isopropylmalate dehydratase small subunit